MLRLVLLVVLAVGCSAQGMLGFPAGCVRGDCTAYVQWTVASGGNVQFDLEGAAEGWVAVGVSADRVMGTNGIDDVFACQRDATTDEVYAQDTFNPQSPRGNMRDTNQEGFQLISSSFSGGRIFCTFSRRIIAENVNEDRYLDESAFLLLAVGATRAPSGQDVVLAAHASNARWSSAAQVTLAPAPIGMLGFPADCDRATCTAYVQWTVVSGGNVQFDLEGEAEGWVAVGVSADRVMGGDGIDDVFACQRDAATDVVYAQDTFNPQSPRGNMRDTNQEGFQLISSSFSGGRISCTFTRSILADNVAEDRNLAQSAFLLLAVDDARAPPGQDVVLARHDRTARWASAAQVVLAPPVGMLGFPADCDRATCTAYVQWTVVSGGNVQFDLEGEAEGWVAVGVSADRVMGTDGIDDVFACQRDAATDVVYAQDTFNPQSPRGNMRDTNQNGFQLISSSFSGGRISCTFTRSILADNVAEDRNLAQSAFLLLAVDDARAPPGQDVVLAQHDRTARWASAAQVVLVPPMGVFRAPSGCSRAACTFYVQWTVVSTDTIQFQMEGTAEGWVAVGVSADQRMGGDGIDDVFVCQRDTTTDVVYAEDTFNPQSPRGNMRDSDQSEFQLITSSYTSGRILCSFTRSIMAGNMSEDRNLNQSAFLLAALGVTRGGPNVAISAHNSVSRWASATQAVLSDDSVTLEPAAAPPIEQGMFRVPTGCIRESCIAYVQWTLMGNDTIQFELEGMSMGWVAVGVSADRLMGVTGIDDVFVCQRDATTDVVYAQDTFNPQSPRGNMPDSDQSGFDLITSSFANGRISCMFTRSILAGGNEDRNLNESAFLLVAFGNRRGGPNVTISAHNPSSRWASAAQTVLSDPAPATGQVGMFGFPAGCTRADCTVYAEWALVSPGSDTLRFELEGTAEGWVAFGASADQVMGGNGIDDVFVCQRAVGGDTVVAQDTYNPQSPRGNIRDTDQSGFQTIEASFTNGRISCTFTRILSTGDVNEDRDLSQPVFVFLAAGSVRGGPNVAIDQHTDRAAALAPVVLPAGQSAAIACLADPLIRVHGILMYLAWVWLVPTAYFFAANMRPAMPTGKWFQIHRALMLIAIVPSVVGFILIFVAFRNSGNPNGLIVLGSLNPTGTTHYVFGLIIILLQFTNPIISFCRCKPGGKNRWIFNWIHGYIVGYGVIILALINVGIGIWLYSRRAYSQTDSSLYYPFWVWLAFIIVFSLWDTFLFIYSKWIGPRLDKMWKKEGNEFEMKPTNANSGDKEDPPKKEPSKDAPLRYGFLIFNIFLLVVPGLVIMLLIAIGCI